MHKVVNDVIDILTSKLDQTKGTRQSWPCSMEYYSLHLGLQAPSLNNVVGTGVYVISVSQALITTA